MKEKNGVYLSAYPMMALTLILASILLIGFMQKILFLLILGGVGVLFVAPGFFVVKPNDAAGLVLLGKYHGSVRESGFHWALPLYQKVKTTLRLHNLTTEKIKVNDQKGNPIEISAVVVWKVDDTAKALFGVDQVNSFVEIQSESAIRQLATLYPYDNHDAMGQKTLRENVNEVNKSLSNQLKERFEKAGVEVIEARINHLAYAPEIAPIMLRRQAAEAVIGARHKLVEGAVGMVHMAIEKLSEKHIVNLDEERKATMVSNLLVVLCGETEAKPVINTGSLYS